MEITRQTGNRTIRESVRIPDGFNGSKVRVIEI